MNAIFLDRDGVLIRKAPEGEYVEDWGDVEFLPGALDATATFARSGRRVIIVTNQRGVATGKIELSKLQEIHRRMEHVIANHGGHVTAVYYCPHDVSEGCACRKPKPGMLLQAAAEHGLQLPECWMVGDARSDIAAGRSAGCKTALITRSEDYRCWVEKPDLSARSLPEVAEQILAFQPIKVGRHS